MKKISHHCDSGSYRCDFPGSGGVRCDHLRHHRSGGVEAPIYPLGGAMA